MVRTLIPLVSSRQEKKGKKKKKNEGTRDTGWYSLFVHQSEGHTSCPSYDSSTVTLSEVRTPFSDLTVGDTTFVGRECYHSPVSYTHVDRCHGSHPPFVRRKISVN